MDVDPRGVDRRGVLYVATGAVHVAAARQSALSVRAHCQALPIHIFSDAAGLEWVARQPATPFTSIGPLEDAHRRSKVDCLARTPFDRTLYLDSDTEVCGSVDEVFDLLDRFDIALAHAHRRNHQDTLQTWRVAIPPSFPQFNSGVMTYRSSEKVLGLLHDWQRAYREAGFRKDQVTLRELLWLSDLRIATLPPEYNIRYRKYLHVWREDEARPRVLHFARFQHASPMKDLASLIRSHEIGRRLVRTLRKLAAWAMHGRTVRSSPREMPTENHGD